VETGPRRAIVWAFAVPVLALLCLWQFRSAAPLSRVTLFSVMFVIQVTVAGAEQAHVFLRSAMRSEETLKEAIGANYDRVLIQAVIMMSFLDYIYLIEYAHWHLVPALERRTLQWMGVAAAIASLLILGWADRWLSRHFANDESAKRIMTGGPYRFARHPRYTAILLGKLAAPLLLGSVIAWIVFPVWVYLILQRIRREEPHLQDLFGTAYEVYASRTARLIPGLY
jgi:protein-S-isoprenylcysteine O-methyltransferase Ste14